MIFKAHVRRHSHIDRRWRTEKRLGGMIAGTFFRINGTIQAGRYEAEDVKNVDKLLNNHCIVVETFGRPPGDDRVVKHISEMTDEDIAHFEQARIDLENDKDYPDLEYLLEEESEVPIEGFEEHLAEIPTEAPKRRGRPPKVTE